MIDLVRQKTIEKGAIEQLMEDAIDSISYGSIYFDSGEWIVVQINKKITKKSFNIIKDITFWPEFYKGVLVIDKDKKIKYIVSSENKLPKILTLNQALKEDIFCKEDLNLYEYNYIKHTFMKERINEKNRVSQ